MLPRRRGAAQVGPIDDVALLPDDAAASALPPGQSVTPPDTSITAPLM